MEKQNINKKSAGSSATPIRRVIISKNNLIVNAIGSVEIATQIFNYKLIQEVRLDRKNKEVKILLYNGDAFYRVYKVAENDKRDEAKKVEELNVFYNRLVATIVKLSKEEQDNLSKNSPQPQVK